MTDPVKINLEGQIRCVGREIGLRKAVYPRFVKSGKISQEKADFEIVAMECVYETLKRLRDEESTKVPS